MKASWRVLSTPKRWGPLPGVSKKDVFWGYHFVTGSLMHSLARSGRIDQLSGGLCKSEDFKAVKARMADFMAAGFLALKD